MNGSAEPAARGAAVIVLAGALLGFGYNYLGQLSRPARGLAWISAPKELPSLEAQFPGATPVNPTPAAPPPKAAETPAPAPESRAAARTPVQPPAAQPPARPAEPPTASVADPDDPLGVTAETGNGEGLPEIPDLDRPFAVQIATVKRFFDAGAAYIVDARDVEEFEEGHIPGAVNLPFSTAGTDPARLEAIRPGEKPIIVYCGGGTCEVSMTLAETLVYQYAQRKVLVYMGGFPEWQSAGYPVQKGKGDEVKG